jgi:hypothetical protein
MSRFDVVALISSYNEADVIDQVLAHLVKQGAMAYLIDDGSTDETVEIAAKWLGRGLIEIERRPASDTFDWLSILRRKAALAEELDAAWLIHHDADEFRYAPFEGMTLAESLARVQELGYNAVDFRVLNFRPLTDDEPDAANVQRSMTFYEPGDTWDATQIKAWRNRRGVDLVESGGHEAAFENREVFPIQFLVRHYPIRGQAHGRRKLFSERLTRFSPVELSRGWHRQYDAFVAGGPLAWRRGELTEFDEAEVFKQLRSTHRDSARLHNAHIVHTDLRGQIQAADLKLQQERMQIQALCQQVRNLEDALRRRQAENDRVQRSAEESANAADRERAVLKNELDAMRNSWSWRLTASLRMLGSLFHRRGM